MLEPVMSETLIKNSPDHAVNNKLAPFSDATPIKAGDPQSQKFDDALFKVRKAINFSESYSRERSSDQLADVRKEKELYLTAENVKFQDLYDWNNKGQQFTEGGFKKAKTGTLVTCNNMKIALFRMADVLYAIDEKCPHMGGPLHMGDIENLGKANIMCVICPWHKWRLELSSGKLKMPPGRNKRIEVYPTKILSDGAIKIGFSEISNFFFNCTDEI